MGSRPLYGPRSGIWDWPARTVSGAGSPEHIVLS